MSDSEEKNDKSKVVSSAVQAVEVSNEELSENILLDCLDPVNKAVATKTEKYVNDKLSVDETWGVGRCCLYTTAISGLMLLIGYLLALSFDLFIAVDGKLTINQLSFLNYSVKAIAVTSFVLIVRAYSRMSDKALGYSGFIFAFSIMALF